jgi:hypothetical protein
MAREAKEKPPVKKSSLSETLHLLANLGVIAGIVFLGVELKQNNDLMEMEARATLTENLQDGWYQVSSDPGLVELFIKDRGGQELSEAEEMRLSAYWMGMLMRREWQYEHFPDAETGVAPACSAYSRPTVPCEGPGVEPRAVPARRARTTSPPSSCVSSRQRSCPGPEDRGSPAARVARRAHRTGRSLRVDPTCGSAVSRSSACGCTR